MRFRLTVFLASFFWLTTFAQHTHSSESVITTSGSAIVYAAPDQIVFSFTLSHIADTAPDARKGLVEKYNNALSAMNSANIAKEHIQTQYMNVSVKYPNKRGSIKGDKKIVATQTIEVCLVDMNKFEGILDKLLAAGIETLKGPTFRNTHIKSHKDEARRKAILAAKSKAELLAKTLGRTLGEAHIITENNSSRHRNNQGGYGASEESMAANMDDDWSFAPGQLKVNASVEVTFFLK